MFNTIHVWEAFVRRNIMFSIIQIRGAKFPIPSLAIPFKVNRFSNFSKSLRWFPGATVELPGLEPVLFRIEKIIFISTIINRVFQTTDCFFQARKVDYDLREKLPMMSWSVMENILIISSAIDIKQPLNGVEDNIFCNIVFHLFLPKLASFQASLILLWELNKKLSY